jgi:hypothetical protein
MGNFLRPQNPGNQGTKWEEPVHRLPCSNCAAPKPPTHVRAAINCTTRTTNKSSNTGEGSMAGNAISRLRRQISLKLAQRLCKISVRRNQVRRHIAIDRLAWENRLFAQRALAVGGSFSVWLRNSGRGKVRPMPYCEGHRPLPEHCSYFWPLRYRPNNCCSGRCGNLCRWSHYASSA